MAFAEVLNSALNLSVSLGDVLTVSAVVGIGTYTLDYVLDKVEKHRN